MNREKFYIMVIIGLVATNLLMGVIMMTAKPKENGQINRENKDIISEKLNFDEDQDFAFQYLRDEHRHNVSHLEQELHQKRKLLFKNLKDSTQNTNLILNDIARINKQMDSFNYIHFAEIKKICKPEQMEDFNELTEKLANMFGKKKPPRPDRKE